MALVALRPRRLIAGDFFNGPRVHFMRNALAPC
jgi:hypothetical protein